MTYTKRFPLPPGTLFGLLQLTAMLASAIGPVVSGLTFDRTGQYGGAILMWLGAFAAATALGFWTPSAHAEASVPPRAVVA